MQCFTPFSDYIKRDDETTAAHSKQIIELFQNRKPIFADLINIWENTDGCEDQY